MTARKLEFSPTAYDKYWQWRMRALYGISGLIDLVLLWLMIFSAPAAVPTQTVPAAVWYAPLVFLLICSAGIAGYGTYRYLRLRKLRALSHVTLADGAVVHYIQQPFISAETARMALEGTRLRDESVEIYAASLSFRVTEVTRLRRSRFGALVLEGTVERTYHDEYLQEEDGAGGHTVMTVKKHKIPAYYEDMEALYRALEKLGAY